jgi:hypothetical protein
MKPLIDPADTLADTILISLADSSLEIVFSQTVLISTNGWAVANFPLGAFEGYWYIVLDHRNHLETWSNGTFAFNTADTSYNFSDNPAKAFGSNEIQIGPGLYGLYAGDIDQDSFIDINDIIYMTPDIQNFAIGYGVGDINGDGVTDGTDYSFMDNRIKLGLEVMIPF